MVSNTKTAVALVALACVVGPAGLPSRSPGLVDAPRVLPGSATESLTVELPTGDLPPDQLDVVLETSEGAYGLALTRHSVRGEGFRTLVGETDVPARDVASVVTYRGEAFSEEGGPSGKVTAALGPSGLKGEIRFESGEVWTLSPEGGAGIHQITRELAPIAADVPSSGDSFGGGDFGGDDFGSDDDASPPLLAASGPYRVIDLAIDADVEFFQHNNSSVTETLADIELIVVGLNELFSSEVGVRFEVTTVVIRTVEPDPYTFASPGGLMNQLKQEWINNQGNIRRDTVHLLTGKDLTNDVHGYALSSSVCSSLIHYSLAESTFTTNLPKRISLSAHQIAHTLGATDCTTQSDCGVMCAEVGGCAGNLLKFGSKAKSGMAGNLAAGCISDSSPTASLPFADGFPTTTINDDLWSYIDGATASTGSVSPPSGPNAIRLSADGAANYQDHEIRSTEIDLSDAESALLSFYSEHRGVESGESLVVESTLNGVIWEELVRVTSNGSNQSSFVLHEVPIPAASLTETFRVRFRAEVNATNDEWFIDDVSVIDVDLVPPVVTQFLLGGTTWQIGTSLSVSAKVTDAKSGVMSVAAKVVDDTVTLGTQPLTLTSGTKYAGDLPANFAGTGERDVMVQLIAMDAQGNTTMQSQVVTVFDNPSFSDIVVVPAELSDLDDIMVGAVVEDSSSLALVEATFKIGQSAATTLPMIFNGLSGRHEATLPSQSKSGELTITLRATDVHGHESGPTKLFLTIWPDVGEPPIIQSLEANPSPLDVGATLSLVAKVKDVDSPPATVTVRLLQSASEIDAGTLLNIEGTNNFEGALMNTSGLSEGEFQVEVTATDLQDNTVQKIFDFNSFVAPAVSGLVVIPASFKSTDSYTISAFVTHSTGVTSAFALASIDGDDIEVPMVFDSGTGRFNAIMQPTGSAGLLVYGVYGTSTSGHTNTPVMSSVTVQPTPITVSMVLPTAGSVGGGTELQVVGTGFIQDVDDGTVELLIDGTPATNVVVESDGLITAFSPVGSGIGFVDVRVRADKGGASLQGTKVNGFKYGVPPDVTSITPNSGSSYGETQIAIFGTGLAADGNPSEIEVRIGPRVATGVTIVNDQALFAIIPGGGSIEKIDEVVVTTPYGSAMLSNAFTNLGIALVERNQGSYSSGLGRPSSIAYVGDRNSDGYDDLAIGFPNAGGGSAGQIRIVSGIDQTAISTLSPITSGPVDFGHQIVAVNDRDADGIPDLVVGDPEANSGAGRVELILSATNSVAWSTNGPTSGELGYSLRSIGDLNGDGNDDLVAGVPGASAGEVWFLDGVSGSEFESVQGVTSGDRFGDVIDARVPDSGNDHRLVVGAPKVASSSGAAYFYRVKATSITISAPFVIDGVTAGDATGPSGSSMSVALLGTPDGDFERIAVGFPGSDIPASNAGRVRLVREGSTSDTWAVNGLSLNAGFGATIASAGQLDGDDHRDLLVSAPGDSGIGFTNSGTVFVLSGETGARAFGIYGDRNSLRLGLGGVAMFPDHDFDAMPELFALSGASSGGDEVWRYALHPASVTLGAMAGHGLSGKIVSRSEQDGLRFDLLDGEELSFKFKPDKKAKKTPFQVTLLNGDGELILSSDSESPDADAALAAKEGKSLSFKHVATESSTVHVVVSNRHTDKAASYSLTSKRTSSGVNELDAVVIPFSNVVLPLEHVFYATAGSTLSGSVKVSGSTLQVTDLIFADADISVFDPKGVKLSKKKNSASLKGSKLKLPYSGDYRLFVLPGAGTGEITLNLKVALPKGKGKLKD